MKAERLQKDGATGTQGRLDLEQCNNVVYIARGDTAEIRIETER